MIVIKNNLFFFVALAYFLILLILGNKNIAYLFNWDVMQLFAMIPYGNYLLVMILMGIAVYTLK